MIVVLARDDPVISKNEGHRNFLIEIPLSRFVGAATGRSSSEAVLIRRLRWRAVVRVIRRGFSANPVRVPFASIGIL